MDIWFVCKNKIVYKFRFIFKVIHINKSVDNNYKENKRKEYCIIVVFNIIRGFINIKLYQCQRQILSNIY